MPAPLYRQIADSLREQVRGLPAGSRIPAEQEIARVWGVSRFTAARAVAEMAQEGLIYRRQGAGSFAAEPPLRRVPGNLLSFTEAVQAAGHVSTHRLLDFAPVAWRADLPFRATERLVLLDRLRLADGVRVARHRSVLAAQVVESTGLTEMIAAAPTFSLYKFLAQRGLAVHEAQERLVARPADNAERDLLGLSQGAVVVAIARRTFARDGTVLDVVDAVYDACRYSYESLLVRNPAANGAAPPSCGESINAAPSRVTPDLAARLGPRVDLCQQRGPRR